MGADDADATDKQKHNNDKEAKAKDGDFKPLAQAKESKKQERTQLGKEKDGLSPQHVSPSCSDPDPSPKSHSLPVLEPLQLRQA